MKKLIVLASVLAALIRPAFAHAFLASAAPAVGSVANASPKDVVLTFTEAVEPRFSRIEVDDDAGTRVDVGDVHGDSGDGKRLSVGVPALKPGAYRVVWHAVSVDTHRTEGRFTFTVTP